MRETRRGWAAGALSHGKGAAREYGLDLWGALRRMTPATVRLVPVRISKADLKSLLDAKQSQPHDWLGMHPAKQGRGKGVVVRALVREAAECSVIDARDAAALMAGGAARWPMQQLAPEGFFEVYIPQQAGVFRYQLRVKLHGGEIHQFYDPYCFLPTLGEQDLYLFNEGNEHRIYEKLGAHFRVTWAGCRAWRSRCGRPPPGGCRWSAISTAGTAATTRCAASGPRASGRFSSRARGGGALQVRDPGPPRATSA